MTAGQVASFAPDYMKAKMAAGRILDLFDRTPAIDSYSDNGNKVKYCIISKIRILCQYCHTNLYLTCIIKKITWGVQNSLK